MHPFALAINDIENNNNNNNLVDEQDSEERAEEVDAVPIPGPKDVAGTDGEVKCVCGAISDDGEHMAECLSCKRWSHLGCVGLTMRSAKRANFLCQIN